jgi:pilus assembly protein CpaE
MQVALLTVHVAPETVAQIRSVAAAMPWDLLPVLSETYFTTTTRPHLSQRAIHAQACIAVVDFDHDYQYALETAEFLRQNFYQKISIVAFSSTTDPDLLMRAMRAGYSEFLGKPFDSDEFADMLARLDYRWATTIARPQKSGKIIPFFGAKGGVGTTTLAVHLAIFLVRDFKKKVLLIDNHTQLGHVALYLGMDGGSHHFSELVQNVSRLDQDLLRGFIATHKSGLDVLGSPEIYPGAPTVDTESVERTLEFLSTQYDFVLLDCEASFEDLSLAIIHLSDSVYLVASPEIGAIRDLSRYVDGLVQNDQATEKLHVIVNRYSSHEAVTTEQIEKAIRLPIAVKVANNYSELVKAINVGEPAPSNRKSEFSAQLTKWAGSLVGGEDKPVKEPVKKGFSLWS